jgi:Putative transposase
LSPDHAAWISPRYQFFLPVKVLGRFFRGKFVAALRRAYSQGQLGFHGQLQLLAHPKAFSSWIRELFRDDWVVYCKRPFGGPEHVIRYLGAYTHRVAISNRRLVSFSDGQVTFRWRDSAHKNKKRLMRLSVDEFLRRFLLHTLPCGFVRIRHFGFLANRKRANLLPLCFHLLGSAGEPATAAGRGSAARKASVWNCPRCGGVMLVIDRFTAAATLARSPPSPGIVR